MTSEIEKLSNQAYIYSIDNISFAKSLRKIGYESKTESELVNFTGKLYNSLSETCDLNNKNKIIVELENSRIFANANLELLQEIKCKESLLNEKNDLIIETFEIIKNIEKIISQIK